MPKPQGLNLEHFTGPWYEVAFLDPKARPRYGVRLEIQRQDDRTLRLRLADSGRWYRQRALGLIAQPEWLLELGEQHSYAVLGAPGRQQLRILSRLPVMDAETFAGVLAPMQDQGFHTEQIQTVAQPEQAPAPLYAHLQALQQQKRAHYRNGKQM
ncbi:MAG: lipocalin family protein [Candidatus Sericytochromatia bacterium]|nr:lipocalin family protein [Candidatus Sericytochromatia bacterium]